MHALAARNLEYTRLKLPRTGKRTAESGEGEERSGDAWCDLKV